MATNSLRIHLLGLAHLPTRRDISTCAYTQKVVKLAKMIKSLGHELYFYGVEGSKVDCTEYIEVLSEKTRLDCYGKYDWNSQFFRHDGKDLAYTTFAKYAISAINLRKRPNDILLIPMGNYQKRIADEVKLNLTVESGIGYTGIFTNYKVFESYAWMNHMYGQLRQMCGSWYDTVIPNYYNINDFPMGKHDGDYFLFIGRLIENKGLHIAMQVCEKIGKKLVIAGQGDIKQFSNTKCDYEFVGAVGPEKRAELMGNAIAVFVPTLYIGPFEGVNVEAQLCGTPVITTDWGVFNETVENWKTGVRCRTFKDFVLAARQVSSFDHEYIQKRARENWDMEVIKYRYEDYFFRLQDIVTGKGWYELHE